MADADNPMDMTESERDEFLADLHVGILAIARKDKGPLALPIWYQYEDGDVVIHMDGSSVKAKLLRATGRATMTVQTEAPPYKYVAVEGPVVVQAEERDDLAMAVRYLGPEFGRLGFCRQPIPLAKSHVSHRSGVSRATTDSSVLGLLSTYHRPNSGPR